MDEFYDEESMDALKHEDDHLFENEVVREDHDLFLVDTFLREVFRVNR